MKKPRKIKGPKVIHVWDDCWQFNFYLLAPCSSEQMVEWGKKTFGVSLDPQIASGKCFLLNEGRIVMVLMEWKGRPKDWALLSHECVHAAVLCLQTAGVTVAADDGETLAYLQQSLMRRFGELL